VPRWVTADVGGEWAVPPVDIWHDRALFHFLTAPETRAHYRRHLRDTLKTGGTAIVATFAPDGPERCSGLPVVRYSPDTMARELGPGLELVAAVPHVHTTPCGTAQSFVYCRFRRID